MRPWRCSSSLNTRSAGPPSWTPGSCRGAMAPEQPEDWPGENWPAHTGEKVLTQRVECSQRRRQNEVERAPGGWWSQGFSAGDQINTTHIIGFLMFLRLPYLSRPKMLELREIAALTACRELQKETNVHDSPCLSNRAAIHRAESCRKGTKEEKNMQGGGGGVFNRG